MPPRGMNRADLNHARDLVRAFVHSVDQVINIADLANLKPVLRRGVTQHRDLYSAFNEMLKSVQSL
jgi:hypothetical protein